MRKWIVFKATGKEQDWKNRKFAHSGSLTNIIAEHFDSSNSEIPEPGYRPPEFIRVEQFTDPQYPAAKTHYRQGDWEVVRVETYEHEVGRPYAEYDLIVVCYCQYNPINAPLKPMPERQVLIDSFGGDQEAYDRWLTSQKTPTEV
ncbi:MAG: hypothetical protein WBB29_11185 [Geitlerinemataceae cyanobacterium]